MALTDEEAREFGLPTEQQRADAYWDACVAYRAEYPAANHIAWFETEAALYRRRYGRLAPGKDDVFHDSSDPENRAQRDAYSKSGLLYMDMVLALARAWERIEDLESRLEDTEIELRDALAGGSDGED